MRSDSDSADIEFAEEINKALSEGDWGRALEIHRAYALDIPWSVRRASAALMRALAMVDGG